MGDARLDDGVIHAERAGRGGVERRRVWREAEDGGNGGERVERIGGFEELSGGANGEHAPTLAPLARGTATAMLRGASFDRASLRGQFVR